MGFSADFLLMLGTRNGIFENAKESLRKLAHFTAFLCSKDKKKRDYRGGYDPVFPPFGPDWGHKGEPIVETLPFHEFSGFSEYNLFSRL